MRETLRHALFGFSVANSNSAFKKHLYPYVYIYISNLTWSSIKEMDNLIDQICVHVISYFRRGALGPEATLDGATSDGRRRSRIKPLLCTFEYRAIHHNSSG